MGKVGQQQHYCPLFGPQSGTAMDITRPQFSASSSLANPFATIDPLLGTEEAGNPAPATEQVSGSKPPSVQAILTPDILDEKLQNLLLQITRNIAAGVGKISLELRGEITQIGERADALQNKFDEMVNYVQALEEENYTLKLSVSQLQLQQKDLENRERRQNLCF